MKDLWGRDNVEVAIQRLQQFEPPEGYWLADSGGKDSSVVRALTIMAGVKYEGHYALTTIDPPELVRFIRQHHPETIFDHPEKPFLTRLVEKGFPLRTKRWCCEEYKERGGTGRRVLTGIRWAESSKRRIRRMVETCFKDKSKTYINPIIDWTDSDVWSFMRERNIPYCQLYDQGFKRLGCIMCPMSSNRVYEAERWPKFRDNFEKAFCRLWQKNQGRPSYRRWKSGPEMFAWWLANRRADNEDQLVMFE